MTSVVEMLFARSPPYKFKKSKNGRPLVERPFLREQRLSNAQGRGLCEANAGHAPWGVVCWGRGIVTWRRPGEIGALAQALLLEIEEKGVPNLDSNFLIKKKGPGLRNAWFHVGGWVVKNLLYLTLVHDATAPGVTILYFKLLFAWEKTHCSP